MEKTEYLKKIKLARYKNLSRNCKTNAEFCLKLKLKQDLLNLGYDETYLNNEINDFLNMPEEKFEQCIRIKSRNLFNKIDNIIIKNGNFNSKNYIDIYYEIEEILAYGIKAAYIISQEENNFKLTHAIKIVSNSKIYIFNKK